MLGQFRSTALLLTGLILSGGVRAQDPAPGIVNWPAPLFWAAGEAPPYADSLEGGVLRPKTTTPTSPVPFIGITPCRIVDTRDSSFPPGYGPPSLSPGIANGRTFVLAGQCGIAGGAQAVSLNITVTNTLGPGYIVIYPQDGNFPPVSTLNYFAGQTVANAAIVPLGTAGGITVVAGVSGADVIIDTNGYYAGAGVGFANTFLGIDAGNYTMTGDHNTASGVSALFSNTTGSYNTAHGLGALYRNTVGSYNTASGVAALYSNTTGSSNTAVGYNALLSNTTGSGNIAIGPNAGLNNETGSNNIYLGTATYGDESNTIRIGDVNSHTRAIFAAVRGVTTGSANAIPVLIDSSGQLGTVSSSLRFKDGVQDMDEASSGLLKLRPVTFRYKGRAEAPLQFGLIAEEVQRVLPELVVCDSAGEAETVLYHEMPAMLLNELQKQQRQIERQNEEVVAQQSRIERQDEEIAKLLTRLTALEDGRPLPIGGRP